jgi:hypothetical protein
MPALRWGALDWLAVVHFSLMFGLPMPRAAGGARRPTGSGMRLGAGKLGASKAPLEEELKDW